MAVKQSGRHIDKEELLKTIISVSNERKHVKNKKETTFGPRPLIKPANTDLKNEL